MMTFLLKVDHIISILQRIYFIQQYNKCPWYYYTYSNLLLKNTKRLICDKIQRVYFVLKYKEYILCLNTKSVFYVEIQRVYFVLKYKEYILIQREK